MGGLNVDHARVMMDAGDVILFGTQKHGVPVAAPCQGGRLSLVFMFSPVQRVQEAAMCLAVGDTPPQAPGQQAVGNDEEEPCFSQEDVHSLCALGFREEEAESSRSLWGRLRSSSEPSALPVTAGVLCNPGRS